MKKTIAFLMLLIALPALAAEDPEQLIKETTNQVISAIRANAESFHEDPSGLYRLVEEVVLPHFDFAAMTNQALGRYKDKVSAEQRPAIEYEFRSLLVRTYGGALLEYNEQGIVYLPMEGRVADGKVKVRSEIEQAGGFPIPIDYLMRLGDDGWKVYDISVDEVSLVTNYRSSFARAIKKTGVDGLIQTLQQRNAAQSN
jgi:phospholipid transport system substrate-binding protein